MKYHGIDRRGLKTLRIRPHTEKLLLLLNILWANPTSAPNCISASFIHIFYFYSPHNEKTSPVSLYFYCYCVFSWCQHIFFVKHIISYIEVEPGQMTKSGFEDHWDWWLRLLPSKKAEQKMQKFRDPPKCTLPTCANSSQQHTPCSRWFIAWQSKGPNRSLETRSLCWHPALCTVQPVMVNTSPFKSTLPS